jgi:hypothetical protein
LLHFLGLREKVKRNPSFAKLIFVLPKQLSEKLKMQMSKKDAVFGLTSKDAMGNDECGVVPGIKEVKKRKLAAMGIDNVRQLLAANLDEIRFVKRYVQAFRKNLESMKDAGCIEKMEQYVIGIDYLENTVVD